MVYLAIMLLLGSVYLNSTTWMVGGSVMVIIFFREYQNAVFLQLDYYYATEEVPGENAAAII